MRAISLQDCEPYKPCLFFERHHLLIARLALHSDYSVMWQIINNCHEAAFTDLPSKYQSYLSIFDTECNHVEGIHLAEQVGRGHAFA